MELSEEVSYYFECSLQFSNIESKNISIALRDKMKEVVVKKISLVEKNIIKFNEKR